LIADAATAGVAAGWDRPGHVNLAVGYRLGEGVRFAVGGRSRRTAWRSRGKASVDTVAVCLIGEKEGAVFGLGGRRTQHECKKQGGKKGAHGTGGEGRSKMPGRIGPDEGWGRNATVLLTLQGQTGFIPPVFWAAKV
jgi:hypothetical protein